MDLDVEPPQAEADSAATGEVQAFLIADIRGYSTFTSQRGAAAAAHLATTFTDLSRDSVAARGGKVLGLRGDEVLAAFPTAGQAVRAALDILKRKMGGDWKVLAAKPCFGQVFERCQKDPTLVPAALALVGASQAQAYIPKVLEMIDKPGTDKALRRAAVEALSQIKSPETIA